MTRSGHDGCSQFLDVHQFASFEARKCQPQPAGDGKDTLNAYGRTREILPIEQVCQRMFWEWMANKSPKQLKMRVFTRIFAKISRMHTRRAARVIKNYEKEEAERNAIEKDSAGKESALAEKGSACAKQSPVIKKEGEYSYSRIVPLLKFCSG
jgi:hypothetical protein